MQELLVVEVIPREKGRTSIRFDNGMEVLLYKGEVTVLGWAYYGERCVEYCFGKNARIPYRVLYVLVAAIAPVVALDLVWTIADILNALMAIPNLIAVLLLTPVIVKETKKYLNNLDAHSDEQVPVMDRKNVK